MPPQTVTDLRPRLIDATITLLAAEGPSAVAARRVTAVVGASTMMVYKLFGGMPGLLNAVIDEGFARLAVRFDAAPRTGDPFADVAVLALIHRAGALENPHLYDLMFGLSNPGGHRPVARERHPEEDSPGFAAAYGQLLAAAAALLASGRARTASGDDVEAVAARLWSLVHGAITLELAGHLARFDDAVASVLAPLAVTAFVGLGDDPERAAASVAAALSAAG
jgi:AcrR family transcriptional regulator